MLYQIGTLLTGRCLLKVSKFNKNMHNKIPHTVIYFFAKTIMISVINTRTISVISPVMYIQVQKIMNNAEYNSSMLNSI